MCCEVVSSTLVVVVCFGGCFIRAVMLIGQYEI